MIRIFRAFVWLRLRMLVNSLERTGARDTLERFSVATDKLGAIVGLVLLIPSSLVLFVLGITGGFALAQSDATLPIALVRLFLLIILIMTLVGPMVLPSRDAGTIVRLLLLPIPRVLLYLAQTAGSLADPWILLCVPVLLGIPIGLAVGLKGLAAVLALVAGLAFLLFITAVTSLAASTIHLLLRDRRRGDLVMLVAIFLIPMFSMLPQLLERQTRGPDGRRLTAEERNALPPPRAERMARLAAPYVPSEMYQRATASAVARPGAAVAPLAELAGLALLAQAIAFAVYRRVLDVPVSLGTRRAGSLGGLWDRVLPGLSTGASAVALTQLRLALRTPRGRATMISPLLMPIFFGIIAGRHDGFTIPGAQGDRGLPIAAIGVFTSILALLPIAMNQFAIDRAGFTRQMLSPLGIGELLAGKAVGNAMIAAIPASLCVVLAALVFRVTAPALWLGLLLAVTGTYLLYAPAAAALSALFPKAVDLNSIGHGSNAHQLAGLLGMLTFVVSAAPPVLLALLALVVLHRTPLVPLLLLGWAAIAFVISRLLFVPVRRLVENRVETLAQYY
jgi:hypothetical protein